MKLAERVRGLGKSLRAAFLTPENLTAWVGLPALAVLGRYVHRSVPVVWVPAAALAAVILTALFYRRKESAKPRGAAAEHFGIKWRYATIAGSPTGADPWPVCPVCDMELTFPVPVQGQYGPIYPHPGFVRCSDCGYEVKTDAYEPELTAEVKKRIYRDWRKARGL